jgi:hypothetical protein
MTGSSRTPSQPRGARGITGGLAAGALVLGLGTVVTGGGPALAAGGSQVAVTNGSVTAAGCSGPTGAVLCAQAGDLLDVTLDQLHPTQPSIGFDQIYYKLGRYGSTKDEEAGNLNKRFDDWCETNGQEQAASVQPGARLSDPSSFTCTVKVGEETPDTLAAMKTVVVGPGGTLYLTDGHHTLTSFLETPDGGPTTHIRLRVRGNLSTLPTAAFWKTMQDNKWVWLRDEKNDPITVDQLPAHLGLSYFHDDPYRGLVYLTRDIGYQAPDEAAEFLEFSWGTWLRGRLNLADYDLTDPASYLSAVRAASEAMSATPGDTVITEGLTADQAGRMAAWNDGKKPTGGEFGKLGVPLSDKKPGKLAFALDYRAKVAVPPTCTRTLTGSYTGPLVVNSGVTCLDRTRLTGPVVVGAGASLVSRGAEITGPVQAVGARTVSLCGTTLTGPLSVVNTKERLTLSGPGCTVNTLNGPVRLVGNPAS